MHLNIPIKESSLLKGAIMKWILASASPRRRELIQQLGVPMLFLAADVDELSITTADPAQNAIEVAMLKVRTIAAHLTTPALIIGADTDVTLDGRILGKPQDDRMAVQMLQSLRHRPHHVHTGIVVFNTVTGQMVSDVSRTTVWMRDYSDEEIAAYVATGDPMDKAGAYAGQDTVFSPIDKIEGCRAGVIGLSLCVLGRLLRSISAPFDESVIEQCERSHQY